MKLFDLSILDTITRAKGFPRCDVCYGFVIVAKDEMEARMMAERAGYRETEHGTDDVPFWMDSSKTQCIELLATGKARIVSCDILHG